MSGPSCVVAPLLSKASFGEFVQSSTHVGLADETHLAEFGIGHSGILDVVHLP